jgi:hypothetical protein
MACECHLQLQRNKGKARTGGASDSTGSSVRQTTSLELTNCRLLREVVQWWLDAAQQSHMTTQVSCCDKGFVTPRAVPAQWVPLHGSSAYVFVIYVVLQTFSGALQRALRYMDIALLWRGTISTRSRPFLAFGLLKFWSSSKVLLEAVSFLAQVVDAI